MSTLSDILGTRSKIARRLILALVLFSSLITAITTAIQLVFDYRIQVSAIENGFSLIESSYLKGLTNSLWSVDDEQIEILLAGLTKLPDMEYAAIRIEGETKWEVGRRTSENILSAEYPLRVEYRNQVRTIGVLTTVASLSDVYLRLWDQFFVILAGNAVKTFLVVGFVYFIFRRMITRRVEALVAGIRKLDLTPPEKSSSPPFPVPNRNSGDEIDDLGGAILELHQDLIDAHQNEIRAVARAEAVLEDRVEARTSELLESETRFEAVVEQMQDGLAIFHESRIIMANPAMARILGRPEGTLIGLNSAEFVAPHDLQNVIEMNRQRTVGEDVQSTYEIDLINHESDRHVPVLVSFGRVVLPDGRVTTVGTLKDVTERKKAEAELAAAHKELLQRERLAILGQLTATVTHELRNPLGAMRTSAFFLSQKLAGADKKIQGAVDRIDRSVVRCDRIIDELLDFSRVRPLDPVPTVIDEWLASVLEELTIPDGVKVERVFSGNGAHCDVDRETMRRAVVNLYDNACQAMTDMEGSERCAERVLTVATRRNGKSFEILFRDTGVGISDEAEAHLFEPMFSTKGFGVGLGLTAVRKIAEQHGGSVEIANNSSPGSNAALRLPVLESDILR